MTKFTSLLINCFNDLMAFNQVEDCPDKENFSIEQMSNIPTTRRGKQVNVVKKTGQAETVGKKKRMTKEERMLLMEEKKQKKEVSAYC